VSGPGVEGAPLRVTVRVQPGASRAKVGGRYGDGEPPVLVVKVAARPVEVSVTTLLDGRQVARSVYKDLRERKIRNYETL
jgi:hypothetical protein